ncbi:MAG: hypothetical protein AAGG45_04740 [Pseudomonadota bacterium]
MFQKVDYRDLNARQKESYNFHKVAARLADYGYNSILLNDDWQGADFIAIHIYDDFLKVQLKGRLTMEKKYLGKNIRVAFFHRNDLYVYDHDAFVAFTIEHKKLGSENTSWNKNGQWSWPNPPQWALDELKQYRVDP